MFFETNFHLIVEVRSTCMYDMNNRGTFLFQKHSLYLSCALTLICNR